MNSNLKLLPAALLVAVLALAGCGGSGSDDSTSTPTEPTEPPPPASVEQLSLDIQAADNKASAAKDMADAALESATDSRDMLTTDQVGGNSGAAMMAASAILQAEMDVAMALADAQAALADANTAQTEVMGLPAGHPHRAALMATVERVIKDAEADIDAIEAISTGIALEGAVLAVEGGNGKGTPRSIANRVGAAIAAALDPDAAAARRPLGLDGPAATVPARHKTVMDDSRGMTWEEIVTRSGGSVKTERLGTIAADASTVTEGNGALKVASIAGMSAADVWATAPAAADISNGSNHPAADYLGIPGAVFCLGSDCEITGGKLVGSWYFSPAGAGTHWVRNTDAATLAETPYVQDSRYATYGHWLTQDATSGDWTVNTFANASSGSGALAADTGLASTAGGVDADEGDKASYSGSAAGMSVRVTGSGDSKTTDSGAFTADVTLSASFGGTPTVSGTVNNFVGDAANAGWSATLESVALGAVDATSITSTGVVVASGRNGLWGANAYGTADDERPSGIYGGFSAHFTDGDAAGAFATTKD